jgi:hypothetical protein
LARKRKDAIDPRYRLRVKQRVAIVEYAVAHGILPASRRFGLDRNRSSTWWSSSAPSNANNAARRKEG